MRFPSPTDQLVSLHPDPSVIGPIGDTKAAGGFRQGVHLYSMSNPLDRGHRDPRSSYSTAFYPDPKLLAYSSSPRTNNTVQAIRKRPSGDGEETAASDENEKRKIGESVIERKRKLSWSRGDDIDRKNSSSHGESLNIKSETPPYRNSGEENSDDLRMNAPIRTTSSSGLVTSDRLPGIAHLDEQMPSPWSIDAARRNANFRASGGEESLRRLSAASPADSSRPWRFSMQDTRSGDYSLPSISHSPSRGGGGDSTFRRPSSPALRDSDRYYQRGGANSVDRAMVYRGVSPSMEGGAYSRRPNSGQERELSPSSQQRLSASNRDWVDEKHGASHLPTNKPYFIDDRRRHSTMLGGYNARDHYTSNERAPLDRRGMDLASGTSTPTYGSVAMHSRQSDSNLPSMQSSFSYDSHPGAASLDRGDSPTYYGDDTLGQRNGNSSPRHHPYGGYGGPGGVSPNTAPRRRGKLPKAVTDLLKSWLLDHSSHPYPTEDEKRRLCSVTGLSISQVSNWFINARRRILVPQGSGSFGVGPPIPPPQGSHQSIDPAMGGGITRMSGGPPSHHHHLPPPHMPSNYSPPPSSNYHQSSHYQMSQPPHHRGSTHLPPLHHQQQQYQHPHPSPYQPQQHDHLSSYKRPSNQGEEDLHRRESSHSPRNTSGRSFDEGGQQ